MPIEGLKNRDLGFEEDEDDIGLEELEIGGKGNWILKKLEEKAIGVLRFQERNFRGGKIVRLIWMKMGFEIKKRDKRWTRWYTLMSHDL